MAKSAPFDVAALKLRDNLPPGSAISLAGIPSPVSFVSLFRDELAARGFCVPARRGEKRDGSKPLG